MAKKKRKNPRRRHHVAKKSYTTNPRRRRHHHAAAKVNPSRRRRYHRNPGDTPKEIAIGIGASLATAIAGPKLASKLPGSPLVKNIAMGVLGLALAWFGRKKSYLVGAGTGLVIAAGTRALTSAVPMLAGDNEMTQDEQHAFMAQLSGPMAGPMEGEDLEGSYFAGPMEGEDLDGEDLEGEFNNPTM